MVCLHVGCACLIRVAAWLLRTDHISKLQFNWQEAVRLPYAYARHNMPLSADMSAFTQVSGVKVYQPGGSQADEIIIEFDFMWSGQQVTASVPPVLCLIRASILMGNLDCGCPPELVRRVS